MDRRAKSAAGPITSPSFQGPPMSSRKVELPSRTSKAVNFGEESCRLSKIELDQQHQGRQTLRSWRGRGGQTTPWVGRGSCRRGAPRCRPTVTGRLAACLSLTSESAQMAGP